MKRIRDTSSPPPGRAWTYIDPETGYRIQHAVYKVVLNEAKKYRQANNLPIGLLFNEQFDQILCENAPLACLEYEPPSMGQKAVAVGKAFARWAAAGFKTRAPEETERILAICQSCPEYGGETGFLKVICKRCGCSKQKIAFSTEHCPLGKW